MSYGAHQLHAGALVALLGCQILVASPATGHSGREIAAPMFPTTVEAARQPAPDAEESSEADANTYPAWWASSPQRMASYGSVVIAVLLLLLYVYRGHLYILQWTISWLLRAASLFAVSVSYDSASVALGMLGLSHFFSIAAALLLIMSVDTYRQRPSINPKYALGLLPLFIWFALAPLAVGRAAVVVPGYLISAATLGTTGAVFLVGVRRARFLGAALIGVALAALGCTHAWIALSMSGAAAPTQVSLELLAVNALLFLFAALGMHLVVFEEMTYELRVANRRLEAARAELHELVITDPLTGCHNRRFFDEVIGRELERHRRYHNALSLLFVDIDSFKAVNDTLGHETGDLVLQYVASFLRRHVREADYLFRWGGDEFLVLMSCSLDQAMQKSFDLKAEFRMAPETAQLPPGVGLSFGCVAVPDEVDDIMVLVRHADEQMYRDKVGAR